MNLFIKLTVFSSVLYLTNSENITDVSKNSSALDSNMTESNIRRIQNARTLYGLLGFLTGYRLGQGLGATSYSSDIRESGHLNLFAKLFNNALYLTYEKYPHPYPFTSYPPMYNPSSPYRPFPENNYPPHLQPPIWYPPIINPVVLPAGHNPVNQQQIINLHEPFNPEDAPNENYQELNDHNSQEIHNNFHTEVKPNDDTGLIENLDMKYFGNTKTSNKTQSKNKVLLDCEILKNCIEAIESEVTTVSAMQESTVGEKLNISMSVSEVTKNESHSINMTESVEEAESTESPNSTQGSGGSIQGDELPISTVVPPTPLPGPIMTDNDGNIAPPAKNSTNDNNDPNPSISPSKYPYPVYHFYGNFSKYEHISITENPMHSGNNVRQIDYYEEPSSFINNYLPLPDDGVELPFAAAPRISEAPTHVDERIEGSAAPNSFHPMGGSFYDSGRGYQAHVEKFNVNQDESGFVPLAKNNFS